jgi:hypothetical protein
MMIALNQGKKIFIASAVITVVALSACSFFFSLKKIEESAQASPAVVVQANSGDYQISHKYSFSWSSDCRGGEAAVWLTTASSSKANIGIMVPLTNFSAADFGDKDKDTRIFFDDIWKINLSRNANKGKISWTVPAALNLPRKYFGSGEGVYYLYSLTDGRIALHKIVKEPVQMPVMPGNYYLRVDIKGKSGCLATGYSQAISIINK